jgi:N-acetylmuramoyl-L-alanine amidase
MKQMRKMKKAIAILPFLLFAPIIVANAEVNHTVTSGDTLWEISQSNNVSLQNLREANDKWDDMIYPGQVIVVPTGQNSTVSQEVAVQSSAQPAKAAPAKNEQKQESQSAQAVSNSDLDLLARIIRAEAQGESYQGKVAVGIVVLNRVDSGQFPNSVKGVIYQPGQFSPVSNGSINKPADAESVRAAKEAMTRQNTLSGALFFYNPSIASGSYHSTRPVVTTIGNHVFVK